MMTGIFLRRKGKNKTLAALLIVSALLLGAGILILIK
jgi:hypothetical protein